MAVIRTRLAPTPSGLIHEGNALNFILTWWYARYHKGSIHLRIDDSDEARCRDQYIEDIFRSLDWLGLDFDSGPSSVSDLKRNYSQRDKKNYYFEELNKAIASDRLFACSCSRKDLKGLFQYPGTCLDSVQDFVAQETSLRLNWPSNNEFHHMNIWRKDDGPAYQLVSVIEDRDLNISHIIRGEDLSASTGFQRDLFSHFSNSSFPQAFHHELIVDSHGQKFSKSQGSDSLMSKYSNKQEFLERVLWQYLGKDLEGVKLEELKTIPPENSFFKGAF